MALIVLSLLSLGASAQPQVRASVDRNQISMNDTLTLSLTVDSMTFSADPEIKVLENDFHIVNQQESSRSSFINGKVTSLRQWDYTLAPKRKGTLAIPSITLGQYQTRPITITVSEAPAQKKTGSEQVYLESDVTPRRGYVQSQLDYTVRVLTSVNFLEASLEPLEVKGAVVESAGEDRYQTTIEGRYYQVIERHFRIYPQHSGELEIPALTLQARVEGYRQSMLDPGRLVVKRSTAHRVRVMPPADAFTGKVWLPAKKVDISEEWSQAPDSIEVGDSVTRTITLRAEGLLGNQLPALPPSEVANAKLYPDQPSIENPESGPWTGQRVESVAIIPTQPGSYELPEIRIPWWNTETNRQEVAVLPARKIQVVGTTAGPATPNSQPQTSRPPQLQPGPTPPGPFTTWPHWGWWLVAGLAFGNLIFAGLWLAARRTPREEASGTRVTAPTSPNEKAAFKALKQACKRKAPSPIRSALLEWGHAAFDRPLNLQQLATQAPELASACRQLDAILYRGSDVTVDTQGLVDGVERCRKRLAEKPQATDNTALKPLYPN
ncbi:BatD family protein [Spongiibacter taiwanensis]|uniref:BatD family protein n=1 Tax=Spongiibacter taiwanensis TaxID=1748242 RepID=UPI002035085F|nr:BatD family protein [Spongiibacter taiwanensis]USA42283.1 BatD family protein [Spongiibacter taiwanensis]